MKCIATQSGEAKAEQSHRAQFMAVRDSRKRRVPGIYTRNGRFYGQLWVSRDDGKKTARKFPLSNADDHPVQTLNEAKEAMEVLRHDRRERQLPTTGIHKPSLAEYIETYFAKAETAQKKKRTLINERQALDRWKRHLGDVRIDRIYTPMIASFKDKRLRSGVSPRTVNLDQIALRNVLKRASDDGYLRELPSLKKLKEATPPKRRLLTPHEFERLLAAVGPACAKNAQQVGDYLRFLAYSGSREQEALHIRWEDVDFEGERVIIGSGGVSKNREIREVEFNDKLGALLRDMATRRAPDCTWLFPSPQRGPRDDHAITFRESLRLVRTAAGLEWVGFHDLRHSFASYCVMAGLDFMTIAAWLGHKDGGILVGKIYRHLLDDHRKQAARKVRFDLAVVEAA
jgi:integrase